MEGRRMIDMMGALGSIYGQSPVANGDLDMRRYISLLGLMDAYMSG